MKYKVEFSFGKSWYSKDDVYSTKEKAEAAAEKWRESNPRSQYRVTEA